MNRHSPVPVAQAVSPLLPARFAFRELRGGLHGFHVLISCIALGVMAIAGVGSFSESLSGGLAREGRTILGGDAAFSLIHREATREEKAFLEARGAVSAAATMRAIARASADRMTLVEIKAVDARYPLAGEAALEPALPLANALAEHAGAFGAAADPALLVRLDLRVGDRISVGEARFEIRAAIRNEPDKLAGGIGFGPRLLIGEAGLRATGLLQPGSLVRWHYRVAFADRDTSGEATKRIVRDVRAAMPEAGWDIRTRGNASPALERNVERFTQFLTLVGLTALLVGGVGVANAIKSHLDRKRNSIAVMKALGARGARIFVLFLTQVMLLAAIGAVIGLAVGAALPFAIVALFGAVIPLPVDPAIQPDQLALALLYGLMTALTFAIWPLGRAHDIPVSALFRDHVDSRHDWPRRRYVIAAVAAGLALAVLAIMLAYDRHIATIFVAAAAATFVALRLVAHLIMAAARRLPHVRSTAWRLAVANIHRPGALTPTIVLSLGLGLTLLVAVTQIDGNLRRQFQAALPDKAPAFFFVDIQSADTERFDAFIKERVPQARLERVPMLRGRIVSARGVPAEELRPPPDAAWVLQGDRGITHARDVPPGSRIVAGQWWDADYQGPPLLSFEKRLADTLGLKLGDPVVVNVLGRNITATIANMRVVDWHSLGINFVLVLSPNTLRGAPHTHIATLTYPGGSSLEQETGLLKAVAAAFPTVTTVRVKDTLEAVGAVVANLTTGIRGASLITLLAAALVLAGALAASHHHRVYDAVILKVLGATRARLLAAYALEYSILGAVTALFGMAAGSVAAWLIMTEIMSLSYVWLPLPAMAAAGAALALTLSFGLTGTFGALGRRPAPVLRNL
ncbi:MAG: FtsX-like permease family protein [Pseudorhodoplanes sp.]|nr:MAG: FtsX-like permease family protein [Pseudorhodoplanes sp.]